MRTRCVRILLLLFWSTFLCHSFLSISQTCRHVKTVVSSTQPSVQYRGKRETELLEGKLAILEQVVTELHRLESKHQDSIAACKQEHRLEILKLQKEVDEKNLLAWKQQEEIESLRGSLAPLNDEAETKSLIAGLKRGCVIKEHELSALQEHIVRITERNEQNTVSLQNNLTEKADESAALLEKLQEESLKHEKEIEQLVARLTNRDRKLEKQVENLKSEQTTAFKEIGVKEEQIQILQAEVVKQGAETKNKDLIQIATAAVEAAEKREKAAIQIREATEKRLRQMWFLLKVQWMTLQVLAEEQRDCEAENQCLTAGLKVAETKAFEAETLLLDKSENVWQKIKAHLPRRLVKFRN